MRIKRGVSAHKKHKKLLKATKGYLGSNHKLIKRAKEAMWHAGAYSSRHRKRRASDYRTLWISRINAALTPHDVKYSQFINLMMKANIVLDRKVLAALALDRPKDFDAVVALIK